ncbi:MAG: FkbM family methyltransferase [Saprospiraceae bacterium]
MRLHRFTNMLRNVENWSAYLLYKFGGKKADSFTFRLRNGFSITVPRRILPEFKESVFEQAYFRHLPAQFLDKPDPTVIDIGANVGFFATLAFLKLKNPNVFSFEPIQRNFAELQRNTTALGPRLTLVNKAVSNNEGEIVLKFDSNQAVTTSASIFDNSLGSDEERVASTTLTAIFRDYGLSHTDILKLDCEGAEYGILYDTPPALFEKIGCITMETHAGVQANENNNALADYLKKLGYTVVTRSGSFIWAFRP